MPSKATTVEAYLSELPEDRRAAVAAVRKVFLDNLDEGFAEGMSYGMIGYNVPHSRYPAGYHCNPEQPLPFGGLASQKGHMSLYLFGLYMDQVGGKRGPLLTWFEEAWKKAGKKLDMGKSCVRFKKLDDLALDVLAQALRRMKCDEFITTYERGLDPRVREKLKGQGAAAPAKKPAAKKPAAKKKPVSKKKPAR
ncbi:MAG: DUF1801 domain-containing protein [Planctomycetaceae bacterium]|nr:DUF1801 domain-containing protein [Planctomycetaceae bacterium]